jgi:hypothetical protein
MEVDWVWHLVAGVLFVVLMTALLMTAQHEWAVVAAIVGIFAIVYLVGAAKSG